MKIPCADDKSGNQREFYNRLYSGEDLVGYRLGCDLLLWYEKRLVRSMISEVHDGVLELGCGQGSNIFFIDDDGGVKVGLDISLMGLIRAKERADSLGRGDIHFIAADVRHLPIKDGSFGLAFARDLLHHTSKPSDVVAEMRRMTVPGGCIVVAEGNILNPQFILAAILLKTERGLFASNRWTIKDYFSKAGIRDVTVTLKELFPRHLILSPRLPLHKLVCNLPEAALKLFGFLESFFEKVPVAREAANYVVVTGRK